MVYGTGRGLNRGGAGLGFRGASPPWPYIGRGRGGLPRCQYPGVIPTDPSFYPGQDVTQYKPVMAREQQINSLKREANFVRKHMEDVEARIKELEAQKK